MAAQPSYSAEIPSGTLIETLRFRAEHQSDRLAYGFLTDGESQEVQVTYGQLDRLARAIGALLQEIGDAGQPVLLLYPPGLDFVAAFFGCTFAGMTAVPAYPPHPGRAGRVLPRLRAILESAQPRAVLTTSELLHAV